MKTLIQNLEIDLYESPVYEKNIDKYGQTDFQCVCCARPLKAGDKYKMVHMSTNWKALHTSIIDAKDAEINGLQSQGYFEIGNECAKKMPKDYIH